MTAQVVQLVEQHDKLALGGMLAWPSIIDDVCEIITGEDFRDQRHEVIFDAIIAQHAAGEPVGVVEVADRLARADQLARVGGTAGLFEIAGACASGANATWHAQRVRDAAILRKVGMVGARMTQLSGEHASGDEVLSVVDAARAELDALTVVEEVDVPTERAVYDAIAALEEPPGMPTPWPSLTEVISGLKPGCLYLVGARPAVGKTLVAQAFVLDAARRGRTGIFFSLEMTRTELYHRMLSSVGEVDAGRIQRRNLTRQDHERLAKAAAHIAGLGPDLVIDDRSSLSVAQMRAKVRAVRRRRDVGVVVIDYVGLVRPPSTAPRNDRRVQVDEISRGLKELAKDLRVPVVALVQMNRNSASRGPDVPPQLHELRESGQLEQDADVAMLLHRNTTDPEQASTLHVGVAKNRHGPTRQLELIFRGHYSRVDEYENGAPC